MKNPKDMTYEELNELIWTIYENDPDVIEQYASEILDKLGSVLWNIGEMWDRVEGVNPRNGTPTEHGTPNRKSMTYKLRKVAGYTYP